MLTSWISKLSRLFFDDQLWEDEHRKREQAAGLEMDVMMMKTWTPKDEETLSLHSMFER